MAAPVYPVVSSTGWNTTLKTYLDAVSGVFNVQNPTYGAVGDGVADDTTAIHAARTAAGTGGTVFFPAGIYKVNGLAANLAGQTWVLAAGATIRAVTTQTAITISAANISLKGLAETSIIDGNSVGSTAGSTLYVTSAGTDVTVSSLGFINCAGIGINCQGDRVTIDDNQVTNSGNAGIFLSNVAGSNLVAPTVSRNRISVASGLAYGIQSHVNPTGVIYRPRFLGNDVSLPATATSGIGIELYGGNSYGAVVGNTVEGSQIGISVDLGPSIAVTGNSVHGAYNYGIELASSTRSTVTGNSIDGNALTNTGVSVSNTAGGWNTVTGNAISNLLANSGKGVFAQNVAGNATAVIGNTISAYRPVSISGQSGHTIVGNSLTVVGTGTLVGVDLDTVTNSTVAYNTISGGTNAAVNVFTGTMNGLIVGPNILLGTTTVDLLNGWTPGTNGTGSRLIRGNIASAGFTTPTVGASPYTYTNTSKAGQYVYIRGGTVTVIARGATTVAVASPATVYADPGETVVITYSVAPTVVVDSK